MNPFCRIHVTAPEWSWPDIRPCFFAFGRTSPHHPSDDFSRVAFEPGAGWTYVLEGRFFVRQHNTLHEVQTGQSVLFVKPSTAVLVYPEAVATLGVGFYGAPTTGVIEWLIAHYGSFHRIARNSPAVAAMRELYHHAEKRKARPARFWSVRSYEWLLLLWRELEKRKIPSTDPPSILRDSKLLGLSHPNFKSFAEGMGYDPGYLSRSIKKSWASESPARVLRVGRLQKAEELLRTSNLPVREIAAKACYSGPNAFSAAFRQEYGLPPLRYRHASRWKGQLPSSSLATEPRMPGNTEGF